LNFPLSSSLPILKDLVLLGGGHSHVAVLKRFGMPPMPGVRVTLISRAVDTPYSGMLPGLIAGHYTRDDAYIDLQPLARFAGARAVFDEAIGLDLARRHVQFRSRPPISYDVLSIDIGSTPNLQVAGAADHAVAVKPIDRLLDRWSALTARVLADDATKRIAVVGGGAGGVELLLAVQYSLRKLLAHAGRGEHRLEYHLFTEGDRILPTHNASVRRRFERILGRRDVQVHRGSAVVEVAAGAIHTADGRTHEIDETLWTTQAAAAPWLAESGLAVDEQGFVQVSRTLQSTSHAGVFAAGDIASMVRDPRPKSGVFAVRQGPPLARNLRRALLGEPLEPYRPQRQFLSLISTGDQYAIASRGPIAFEGAWVWRWKDRIDRRFMRLYNDLPELPAPGVPQVPAGLADSDAIATLTETAMRCGGCGAKVGASVLTRALRQVGVASDPSVLVGLESPDDAAVIETGSEEATVHTVDFFRAMIDDPYVFGQVVATHSLSDVYAMGAEPSSALAIVTVPQGREVSVEETLTHVMAGAAVVLREAGVALVGGHTSEGAELAMGFAVNGRVNRARVLRKSGLRAGDRLILTKAIGTGTLFAADMRHRARGRWIAAATRSMTQSNRLAACCIERHGATACTDVTGFGLAGHLVEMLQASGTDAELSLATVPVLEGAEQTVALGIFSSLQPQNVRIRRAITAAPEALTHPRFPLLFDPQTSGGLLAGVPAAAAHACVDALRSLGYGESAIIGTISTRDHHAETITVHLSASRDRKP
jgi:selenide, water dikinase